MAINHGSLSARLTSKKTLKGTVQTATIAYESDYERLTNKPSINNIEVIGDLSLDDLGIVNNVQPDWEQTDTEAEDYIKNKPEIPAAQIQSDWEQTDEEAKDYIKNKPEIPLAQVQSDWNEADNTKPDFIKNKPTIPPEQVNSDWNAVSGKAQILNKPTIPSVVANPDNTTENLTSIGINGTNYAIQGGGGGGAVNDVKVNETSVVDSQGIANIDLTGYATTSDIPTDLADLQDDSTHRLVTDTEKTTWNGKSDFSGSYTDLTDKPTLGTASALDVASSGDASTSEVVKGNDTRLTDSRNAKDVYPWAKESTKPTYAYSEIQNTPTLGTASAKDYVNSVVDGSSDLVTSDAVHDYVDSAISGVYKPSGNKTCAELLPALLIASNLGNVYNMTDSGVTTSDFVEGAGKTIEVGDNVVIVDVGTQNNASYKFDLLSGMVDLSNYIQKSATSGLMKNDGSVDTNSYATTSQIPDISGKADKVTSAVDGNFAGLDANGNLTDSGHKHSDYLTQHQDISGKADKIAISSVETTNTAVSAHAVGSYFINASGQFVKATSAIAIGDTIIVKPTVGYNCEETTIADVLKSANDNIGNLSSLTTKVKDNIVNAVNEVNVVLPKGTIPSITVNGVGLTIANGNKVTMVAGGLNVAGDVSNVSINSTSYSIVRKYDGTSIVASNPELIIENNKIRLKADITGLSKDILCYMAWSGSLTLS